MNRTIRNFGIAGASVMAFFAFDSATPQTGSVHAQEVAGTLDDMSDKTRYQLKRRGDLFIRLDRKTGKMSVCKLNGENLVCRMSADDRDALVGELENLQQRIARLEDDLGEGTRQKPDLQDRKRNRDDHDYPLESEIDEAVEYSGRVIRKFFDVMKELRRDLNE